MSALSVALNLFSRGGSILSGGASVADAARNNTPKLEDEAIVEVVGQPGSTKRQLYYLALATASSLVRRFDFARFASPPPGMLMVEYDAADNWVRCTLRYRTSLLASAVGQALGDALLNFGRAPFLPRLEYAAEQGSLKDYAQAPVLAGPNETLVGKPFNFTGSLTPGVPNDPDAGTLGFGGQIGAPRLPFAGKTILTSSPFVGGDPRIPTPDPYRPGEGNRMASPNPKPPGDNRSRGGVPAYSAVGLDRPGLTSDVQPSTMSQLLVPLVYAALADPGGDRLDHFPVPTAGPTGG